MGQVHHAEASNLQATCCCAGKRLYESARKGVDVDRQPRSVTVTAFELRRDPADQRSVHFRVACSKGTYVRSLAHDLVGVTPVCCINAWYARPTLHVPLAQQRVLRSCRQSLTMLDAVSC